MTDFFLWQKERVSKLINFNGDILFFNNFRKKTKSKKYCVYQTEDLKHKNKLTKEYKIFLDNAEKVYDYSKVNQKFYKRGVHLPIIIENKPKLIDNKKVYDILFFGFQSPRRKNIFKILKKYYSVKLVDRLYGEDLFNEISKSKVVLSVGTYDNDYNDSFRIIPAIELGGKIIAERTKENWFNEYLMKECPNRVCLFNVETIIKDIKGFI